MSMTTPIVDFVRSYAKSGTARLHMPGHKGQSLLGFEPLDITEICGADELYAPELDRYPFLKKVPEEVIHAQIEEALKNGGIDAAMEVARNTRGPIASIYYQGLLRYNQGLDAVEKSIVSYGSVQTGQMESGLTWIGLFIALSPMLGFMGTVVGMIDAFDAIQAAGDISPTLVAGGIKVALLTTLMGLIAAVILQLFYNYIVSKIDSLVNEMEDTSITLTDILTAYNKK